MTTAEFKRTAGKITAFTVEGHSGYGEAGEDIVCASVSAVVWHTVHGLSEVGGIPVTCENRDGFVSCKIPCLSPAEREKADLLLESMLAFLRELSGQYEQFVKVMEV